MGLPVLLVDLFGTLIKEGSDAEAHKELSKWLSDTNGGFSWEEHYNLYKSLVDKGFGSGEAVWEALKRLSSEKGFKIPIFKENVLRMHVRFHIEKAELYDDVHPALKLASRLFDSIGLVSDSDVEVADGILEATGIKSYFLVVVVSGEIGIRKPDPRIFLEAAKRLNVSPEECVMIGDSLRDIKGSKNAGMKSVLLLRNPIKVLKAGGPKPDAIAHEMVDAVKKAASLLKVKV